MPKEHYVPQSYLDAFAPENDSRVSTYSLVKKHEGGDYYPPRDRHPIQKAAAIEGMVGGWFESDETTQTEKEMITSVRKILANDELEAEDIGRLSQFVAFQKSRTPSSILHYEARQNLPEFNEGTRIDTIDGPFNEDWKNALYHNANEGHETLQHMGWLVVENDTEIPFVTSDDPVTHYFECDREELEVVDMDLHGREVYCPLGPNHMLVLLDPSHFAVTPQFPDRELSRVSVDSSREIHKFNLLQALTAFQEVFGPVEDGQYLEQLVTVLCRAFPHEDYVRGNRGDWETLLTATRLACGLGDPERRELYLEEYRDTVLSRRMKSEAVWSYDHAIALIQELRRATPRTGYWADLVD